MNILSRLNLALAPRTLFFCKRCQRYVDFVEAHSQNGLLNINVTCHGVPLALEYQAHVELPLPLELFQEGV